ncbi:hypothetical protein [Moraxella nonliquefaciens]|uniref:Uncharacterized protein n=1 Tax=Moraxella nonliquefaciens TaxID=478 RepID=A0A7T3BXN9_MORNO|nr:hypothetical protein [Moraxella nonliquefaciens]QPT43757.1 hypothetical protein I6G26_06580 [Moraxella nonliquefaciens]QQC30660.1 hypothetical protein I6H63_05375 [Moraxella nonliquefaciens]
MNATAQVPSDESLIKFMQLSEMDKAFDLGMQGSLNAQRQHSFLKPKSLKRKA